MTPIRTRALQAGLLALGVGLAGCANDGSGGLLSTGSVAPAKQEVAAQPPVDPACVQLVSQVDALRKEGIAEKVEKASTGKYKLKKADLAKADALNKANAELQARCSTITPAKGNGATVASPATPAPAAPAAAPAPATPKAAVRPKA
jgi:hypothetical protein